MKLQTLFDTIGRAITSLAAVIFALLMIITANAAANRKHRTEVLISNYATPCGTLKLFEQ